MRMIYLYGLGGRAAGISPALMAATDGIGDVVVPDLPGFNGRPGFEAPTDYLGWLVAVWDALDATGALPCPVIGASIGGMLAADLAILRPEAVTKLVLMAPLGVWDGEFPGADPFGVPTGDRLPLLFAGAVPEAFTERFADQDEGERRMSRYLADVAAASLVWPIPDNGVRNRMHRIGTPNLLLWGEEDAVAPVGLSNLWPAQRRVVVPNAGHLLEWDAPEAVSTCLREFLTA